MLKIISEAIFNVDTRNTDNAAEYVLQQIEKVGMSPPQDKGSDEFFAKQLGYPSARRYIQETGSEIPGCWEPEE